MSWRLILLVNEYGITRETHSPVMCSGQVNKVYQVQLNLGHESNFNLLCRQLGLSVV